MSYHVRPKWEDADLTDDYIFNKVMTDHDICLEVLRRILPHLHIEEIEFPNAQQEITLAPDAHSVRFDIYTTDKNGNHYDVEMQVVDEHNIAKRIRYYQTASTIESYEKGKTYDHVDDSYVIFFCNFDPFGLGLQRYILHKHIDDIPEKIIDDGQTDILFNITSTRHNVDQKMQTFLDIIAKRNVEEHDEFVVKLKKRLEHVKHNRKWKAEYMRLSIYEMDQQRRLEEATIEGQKKGLQQGIKEGIEQGIEQGIKQGIKQENELGIKRLISSLRNLDIDQATIIKELKKQYALTDEQAVKYLKEKEE